ncbi:MMPL family transporter [Streptomyces sp. NPDC088246]|uniref:MMPL family transporter n=1 Tax=Streptomyces sp. NPDC088246 TaxID=3365842 RepID=UPI0038006908
MLFLFVVALGTDYNILIADRIREEMQRPGPARAVVARAVRHTAPAIATAGLVPAGSFVTLATTPGSEQVAFAMALGIMLSALVLSAGAGPPLPHSSAGPSACRSARGPQRVATHSTVRPHLPRNPTRSRRTEAWTGVPQGCMSPVTAARTRSSGLLGWSASVRWTGRGAATRTAAVSGNSSATGRESMASP